MKKETISSQFSKWYKLAEPSRKYLAIQIIVTCMTAVFYTIDPIIAARVITCITKSQYNAAMVWAAVGFVSILLRNVFWHLNNWNAERLMGYSYEKISFKILDKLVKSSSENFKHTSKEKIVNIVTTDIYNVANFGDVLATKLSYFFRAIITIIVVLTSSPIAAVIIVGISIINFFLLNFASKKIGASSKMVSEAKDKMLEHLSDISDARTMIYDSNTYQDHCKQYKQEIKQYEAARTNRTLWKSFVDNWVYVIWQLIICLTTIYLIYLISGNALSLTIYLVIIGYLAPTIEKINSGFLLFKELNVASVSASRIQTLLDFTSKELVEFGNRMTKNIEGTINFFDVCVDSNSAYHTEEVNDLKKINLTIPKGELAVIVGPKACGKRSIFHILRRAIKVDSGKVVLGAMNIYDYSPKIYNHNLTYTTHKPHFFNGTVMSNLQMFDRSKKHVVAACKKIGIYDFIMSQPNGFETTSQEIENWDQKERYLLGLTRAYLAQPDVLMIYEFPTALNMRDRAEVARLFKKLSGTMTILVFASQDDIVPVADRVIYMSRGQIEKIDVKQN